MGFSSMSITLSPKRPSLASLVSPSRPFMASFTLRHEGSRQLLINWNFSRRG
jgi:hypothetical protein